MLRELKKNCNVSAKDLEEKKLLAAKYKRKVLENEKPLEDIDNILAAVDDVDFASGKSDSVKKSTGKKRRIAKRKKKK